MSIELLQGYTERIKRYEKDIQHNYIQIAMNLYEIQEFDLIKDTEFKNIYDYALIEFGFEKTKTVNLISIYKKFFFEERKAKIGILTYGDYSISQLRYMLNFTDEQLNQCNPKLSVRAIKAIKLNLVARATNEDIENTEKLKNDNIVKGVFPDKKEEEKQTTLIVSEFPKAVQTISPGTIETRSIVTETITTQNNNFVPNEYETYKEKYEQNCKDAIKLKIQIEELKHDVDTYKDFLNYIHSELYNINNPIQNDKLDKLCSEMYDFEKSKKLPSKIKFMKEVI